MGLRHPGKEDRQARASKNPNMSERLGTGIFLTEEMDTEMDSQELMELIDFFKRQL